MPLVDFPQITLAPLHDRWRFGEGPHDPVEGCHNDARAKSITHFTRVIEGGAGKLEFPRHPPNRQRLRSQQGRLPAPCKGLAGDRLFHAGTFAPLAVSLIALVMARSYISIQTCASTAAPDRAMRSALACACLRTSPSSGANRLLRAFFTSAEARISSGTLSRPSMFNVRQSSMA